jgi:hypothetical protein
MGEASMTVQLEIPEEVIKVLGPEPQREILEMVLLNLINEERMSIGVAGRLLGLSRLEAIRWYTGHGFHYPNITAEELADELSHEEERKFSGHDGGTTTQRSLR